MQTCPVLNQSLAQRGVAAIEFAFSMIIMLMLVVAIIGYGAYFWAQQKVTKAAGEGVQAALQTGFSQGKVDVNSACVAARQEAGWLDIACTTSVSPCTWTNASGQAQRCAQVSISYNANNWPVLATMSSLASAFSSTAWFPSTLTARAIVQIPQDPTP